MESGPQLLQSEAQSRAARAQLGVARSKYWPGLALSYSESRRGTGQPLAHFGDYTRSAGWNFSLSWTLFNGFQREADQVQARVQSDVAKARAADVRRQLNAQLTQQVSALFTASAQIDIAAANVAAAAEDFRVQNERYRLGAATIVDLSTSQSNLTQAQVNLVQSRFNYLIARAQVEALVGREL
jgi:outer membrane protein TolC